MNQVQIYWNQVRIQHFQEDPGVRKCIFCPEEGFLVGMDSTSSPTLPGSKQIRGEGCVVFSA